jgi:hypothetical protein
MMRTAVIVEASTRPVSALDDKLETLGRAIELVRSVD